MAVSHHAGAEVRPLAMQHHSRQLRLPHLQLVQCGAEAGDKLHVHGVACGRGGQAGQSQRNSQHWQLQLTQAGEVPPCMVDMQGALSTEGCSMYGACV